MDLQSLKLAAFETLKHYGEVCQSVLDLKKEKHLNVTQLNNPEIVLLNVETNFRPKILRTGAKPDWKTIEEIRVKPEAGDLNYKISHNILGVREILSLMKCADNNKCPRCKKYGETTVHALVSCPELRIFWKKVTSQRLKNLL